ncbi:hypothetical protein ACU6U9_17260 [Pseudomonas sp. HK3]
MFKFPDTEKKLKTKISSYRSALRKEKKEHDFISDGSGKRYLLFSLYFLLDDANKSKEYFDWYIEEFPDCAGEPFQNLCWAISLFRMQSLDEARMKLAETMLSNLYLLPELIGNPEKKEHDIWHSSNFDELSYISYLPEEIRNNIKEEEISWLKQEFESFDFRRIKKKYIIIYNKMNTEKDVKERGKLLKESVSLLDTIKCS